MNDFLNTFAGMAANAMVVTLPVVFAVYFGIRHLMARFVEGQERSRYDDFRREAVLSDMRASYERQIADLTREMVATRARFEDANHLLIAGQNRQVSAPTGKAIGVDEFLGSYGIDANSTSVIDDKVFVLTPFSEAERDTYIAIKDVCTEAGFTVSRGDENRAEGDILPQIIHGIVTSAIVVANISARNPNVFFELGIAMALGKPTLLISDTLSDVPFDLQSRRIIVYKGLDDLRAKLTTSLLQTVRGLKL